MGAACINEQDFDEEGHVEMLSAIDEFVSEIRRERLSVRANGPPKYEFQTYLQYRSNSDCKIGAADEEKALQSMSSAYQYNHQLYSTEKVKKI